MDIPYSAEDLTRVLRRHRAALDDGRARARSAEVTGWTDVLSRLSEHGSATPAVVILGPDDIEQISLEQQDDSTWPPPYPIIAVDGSWVIAAAAAETAVRLIWTSRAKE